MNVSEKILAVFQEEFHQWAELDTEKLEFAERFRDACKANYCGRYAKSWSCPPALDSIDTMKKQYTGFQKVFVFTTKTSLEDCFDIETMETARIAHTDLTDRIIAFLQESGEKFKPLGAGSCSICGKCTYPDAPCRFPDRMYPSVESVGIDVVQLAREGGMNYINGENTVTYFSLIFLGSL